MTKIHDSEIHAYGFIKDHLVALGWIYKNPLRTDIGQVYTQNECLENDEFKKLLGLERPENIIKVTESLYYVIEAKSNKKKLEQAIADAQYYAEKINKSRIYKVPFISGVAGNEAEKYTIISKFKVGNSWKTIKINDKDITSLLSSQICNVLLEQQKAELDDLPINEKLFLHSAEKINKILHIGAINKNQRARVMAALLLALIDDTKLNVDSVPIVLIKDINARAENILIRNNKPEFFDCIKINPPPSKDNHIKFKTALVQTIQELENLNIRSAMNSGTDVLGKFYEVFLKYGNGAKEIGIVLTPRHITRFAAEVLDINPCDIVYDPTCGTGGFLVAAFDKARKLAKKSDIEYFKNNGLYGIEQEPEVAALAIVNMIFRGDGKNNITEGNCFSKSLLVNKKGGRLTAFFANNTDLPEVRSAAATKILMNPPFALKKSDEKEYKFVQHALEQMREGGILFSVLPISTMIEQSAEKLWRKNELLKNNTLLAVVTFPPELFYPIGVHTLGIFIRKGIPHDYDKKVLWLRAIHDGFIKVKGKRLISSKEPDLIGQYLNIIKNFIQENSIDETSVPEYFCLKKLDKNDDLIELVPEAYLDSKIPTVKEIESIVDTQMREVVSYMIRYKRDK